MKKKKNRKNLDSFSFLKKTKNDINDFYNEWKKFQKSIKNTS